MGESSRVPSTEPIRVPSETTADVRAGVGYGEGADPFRAGADAARQALDGARGSGSPALVVLFASGDHDPREVLDGVRSVTGPAAPLVGASAPGVMTTPAGPRFDDGPVAVGVLFGGGLEIEIAHRALLTGDEAATGRALGRALAGDSPGIESLLLLSDLFDTDQEIYDIPALLSGLEESLGEWPRAMAGAAVITDFTDRAGWQIVDDRVLQGTATGIALGGGVRMETLVMHGCRPVSRYRTVTETDGLSVHRIDGRPALDALTDLLGPDYLENFDQLPEVRFLTLGMNRGDKFGEVREEDYALAFCSEIDRDTGAIVMSRPIPAGEEVQLMRRNIGLDDVGQRVETFLASLGDRRPVLGIYLDCEGRRSESCGSEGEEAAVVAERLGGRAPLLGAYVGSEIGHAGGEVQSLCYTGVLALLCA